MLLPDTFFLLTISSSWHVLIQLISAERLIDEKLSWNRGLPFSYDLQLQWEYLFKYFSVRVNLVILEMNSCSIDWIKLCFVFTCLKLAYESRKKKEDKKYLIISSVVALNERFCTLLILTYLEAPPLLLILSHKIAKLTALHPTWIKKWNLCLISSFLTRNLMVLETDSWHRHMFNYKLFSPS